MVTIGIIIVIVLFGDSIKDASKESQQLLQHLPSTEIGTDVHESTDGTILRTHRRINPDRNRNVEVRGASVGSPNVTTSLTRKTSKDLTETLKHSEYKKVTNASQKIRFTAPGSASPDHNDTEAHSQNITIHAQVNVSSSMQRNVSAQHLSNKTGVVLDAPLNLADFHKHAEKRAMEDALKKRAALESMRDRKLKPGKSVNTSAYPIKNTHSLNSMTREQNVSQEHRNVYKGIQRTEENNHLFKADNVTHLSYMLYRLIRTHSLTSLIDVPCTSSMFWMPELLQRLEFEIPKFHYRCVVPDDDRLVEAVILYQDLSSAVVVKDSAFWTSKLPAADLAFVWYGIGFMAPKQSWQLLKALQQARTKYVIAPNHPDVTRNHGGPTQHGHVNVRRAPYLFEEPLRVVNNISSTQKRKQLLMYDLKSIRSDLL